MLIELTPEQRNLQSELRNYFESLVSEDERQEMGRGENFGDKYVDIRRTLGRDGWLGVGWPVEYGGRGFGPLEQLIFFEEANRAAVPLPMVTLNTVGPTIAAFGTDEQKREFLPPILAGELEFSIGYTEPGAGTDLAALTTRAVRDGDEYVVSGQKIFTTGGHIADWVWLAVRTDPTAPKHKGISVLLVDTTIPGYSCTPINLIGGGFTNASYYDDMRIPAKYLVGEENAGWKLITTQLNHERVALGPAGRMWKVYEPVLKWANDTELVDGRRVIDLEWVRLSLARVRAKVEAAELFNWRVASLQEHGELNPGDASAMKVYGTELNMEVCRLLLEVLGAPGALVRGSAGAMLHGLLEQEYRGATIGTFGGGVNEVQREIVATAALGLPRAPR